MSVRKGAWLQAPLLLKGFVIAKQSAPIAAQP